MVPDEEGFYTVDDMLLTKEQMLEYFGLRNDPKRSGRRTKEYRWPKSTLLKNTAGDFEC